MIIRSLSCLGLVTALALSLSGCGETPGCGGVAGAAVGGLTSPNQVDAGPAPCR
jgi:hypothetical protein